MNIAHTKEYFYKNLRFPLVLDDLRFSRDNCSQAHSRSTEWEAKAIACQETWEINGYERVSRCAKSKGGTFGNCGHEGDSSRSCNVSLNRDNAIQFCGLRRTTESYYIRQLSFINHIIKRIIKTCNMIEYN